MDVQFQRYLLVILISNILIAVLTWLAFEAIGLEHAGAWGVAAGVLRFIPYLGTVAIVIASAFRLASIWHAYARIICCGCIGRRLLHCWNGVYDVVAGKSRTGERSSAVHRPTIFCLAVGLGRSPARRPFGGYCRSGFRPR